MTNWKEKIAKHKITIDKKSNKVIFGELTMSIIDIKVTEENTQEKIDALKAIELASGKPMVFMITEDLICYLTNDEHMLLLDQVSDEEYVINALRTMLRKVYDRPLTAPAKTIIGNYRD